MASSFTSNLNLNQPSVGDTGWATAVNGNCTALDAMAPLGNLAVAITEVPSATLNVKVAAGSYVKQDGTVGTYAGGTQGITASSTQVLYLDLTSSGALTMASSYPATPHIRLATVVAGSTTITSVADNRQSLNYAGYREPVLTHLLSTAVSLPTIVAGAAAGTSPTVSVGTGSTDVDGTVSIATGTSPGTGVLATITFNTAFSVAPRCQLTPMNAATAALAASIYVGATTATLTINAGVAPSASTSYQWSYAAMG